MDGSTRFAYSNFVVCKSSVCSKTITDEEIVSVLLHLLIYAATDFCLSIVIFNYTLHYYQLPIDA